MNKVFLHLGNEPLANNLNLYYSKNLKLKKLSILKK